MGYPARTSHLPCWGAQGAWETGVARAWGRRRGDLWTAGLICKPSTQAECLPARPPQVQLKADPPSVARTLGDKWLPFPGQGCLSPGVWAGDSAPWPHLGASPRAKCRGPQRARWYGHVAILSSYALWGVGLAVAPTWPGTSVWVCRVHASGFQRPLDPHK